MFLAHSRFVSSRSSQRSQDGSPRSPYGIGGVEAWLLERSTCNSTIAQQGRLGCPSFAVSMRRSDTCAFDDPMCKIATAKGAESWRGDDEEVHRMAAQDAGRGSRLQMYKPRQLRRREATYSLLVRSMGHPK
jgi:hypothetical protein